MTFGAYFIMENSVVLFKYLYALKILRQIIVEQCELELFTKYNYINEAKFRTGFEAGLKLEIIASNQRNKQNRIFQHQIYKNIVLSG